MLIESALVFPLITEISDLKMITSLSVPDLAKNPENPGKRQNIYPKNNQFSNYKDDSSRFESIELQDSTSKTIIVSKSAISIDPEKLQQNCANPENVPFISVCKRTRWLFISLAMILIISIISSVIFYLVQAGRHDIQPDPAELTLQVGHSKSVQFTVT